MPTQNAALKHIDLKLKKPRVLAFLQNQWFQDPPYIRRVMASSSDPERYRRRLASYALFAGCKSGRVLRYHLGDHWCDRITWENASKEIGDVASSVFPADLHHISLRIEEEKPDIVIGFGKVACDALDTIRIRMFKHLPFIEYMVAPHPTARFIDVGASLRSIRTQLQNLQKTHDLDQK